MAIAMLSPGPDIADPLSIHVGNMAGKAYEALVRAAVSTDSASH